MRKVKFFTILLASILFISIIMPNVTVNASSPTTMILTVTPNPALGTDTITFRAEMHPPQVSGYVRFVIFNVENMYDELAYLVNGTAEIQLSHFSGGEYFVFAYYSDGEDYEPSYRFEYLFVKKDPHLSVSCLPSPSYSNTEVQITAFLDTSATGSVEFYDSGEYLGTSTVSFGDASISTILIGEGDHYIHAHYTGNYFNFIESDAYFTQPIIRANPQLSVSGNPNPVDYGEAVTIRAALNPLATGTVTFVENSTELGQASVTNGMAEILSSLPPGSHDITAYYSGDVNYYDDSVSYTQIIDKLNPDLTAASYPNPSYYSESVNYRAFLDPLATGNISFDFGETIITAPIHYGEATCDYDLAPLGNSLFNLIYSGDAIYEQSNTIINQKTVKADPNLNVSCNPNHSVFGDSVTITATLNNLATGSVIFSDGFHFLGTSTISNGTALLTTNNIYAGQQQITAYYNGDMNFNGSITSCEQTVDKAEPSLEITTDQNPVNYGDPLVISATLNQHATGYIVFLDTNTVIGVANVVNGVATITNSTLKPGNHEITAQYSGDGNYYSETKTCTQNVNAFYTVQYINYLNGEHISPNKVVFAPVGSAITETAIDIDGYRLIDADTKTFTLTQDNNTLSFKYVSDTNYLVFIILMVLLIIMIILLIIAFN